MRSMKLLDEALRVGTTENLDAYYEESRRLVQRTMDEVRKVNAMNLTQHEWNLRINELRLKWKEADNDLLKQVIRGEFPLLGEKLE